MKKLHNPFAWYFKCTLLEQLLLLLERAVGARGGKAPTLTTTICTSIISRSIVKMNIVQEMGEDFQGCIRMMILLLDIGWKVMGMMVA